MPAQLPMDFAGEPKQGAHTPGSPCTPPTDEAGAEKDGAASGPPLHESAAAKAESGSAPSSAMHVTRSGREAAVLFGHDPAPKGTGLVTAVITAARPMEREVLLYLAMGESQRPRVQCVAVSWEELEQIAGLERPAAVEAK